MITLLIATRNAHKVGEIADILGERFACQTLSDYFGAPEVVEDADTFAGNASKKATEVALWLTQNPPAEKRMPDFVLADDSGLEVDALGGAPGVQSARFAALDRVAAASSASAAKNAPDDANNAKLLRLLKGIPRNRRTARFRCVLALAPVPDPAHEIRSPVLFDGTCEGWIEIAPRGQRGFGYDPLFVPEGGSCSFAELGEAAKNQLSHRAKALHRLKTYLAGAAG